MANSVSGHFGKNQNQPDQDASGSPKRTVEAFRDTFLVLGGGSVQLAW
jgi:hypothetical protein